ncbi:MAG: hypothetical protein LBM60_00330 [Clostridium sp.]|jgi:hypothetical protein|nr:hypothetical protein [Clostridium sp.]
MEDKTKEIMNDIKRLIGFENMYNGTEDLEQRRVIDGIHIKSREEFWDKATEHLIILSHGMANDDRALITFLENKYFNGYEGDNPKSETYAIRKNQNLRFTLVLPKINGTSIRIMKLIANNGVNPIKAIKTQRKNLLTVRKQLWKELCRKNTNFNREHCQSGRCLLCKNHYIKYFECKRISKERISLRYSDEFLHSSIIIIDGHYIQLENKYSGMDDTKNIVIAFKIDENSVGGLKYPDILYQTIINRTIPNAGKHLRDCGYFMEQTLKPISKYIVGAFIGAFLGVVFSYFLNPVLNNITTTIVKRFSG